MPAWQDTLMVAVPTRHPLLANKSISLEELLSYPLVLCDPQACEGHAKYIDRVLRHADMEQLVVERVASYDMRMALVSAGFALGLIAASHFSMSHDMSVVTHKLAFRFPPPLNNFLQHGGGDGM